MLNLLNSLVTFLPLGVIVNLLVLYHVVLMKNLYNNYFSALNPYIVAEYGFYFKKHFLYSFPSSSLLPVPPLPPTAKPPIFGPCKQLDIELEMVMSLFIYR